MGLGEREGARGGDEEPQSKPNSNPTLEMKSGLFPL